MGNNTTNFLEFVIGSVVGLFAWFFGGIDGFLSVLITCIIVDWIFGTLDRCIHGEFDAKEIFPVWGRKLGELCYVGLAHLFDKYMFGDTATFRTAVTLFYIVVEGKSLISHTTGLGLPVPKFLQSLFLKIEERLETDDTLTRGDSIRNAIDSHIFREPVKKRFDNKEDIEAISKQIFDEQGGVQDDD